jgi:peptide deformylase
MAIRPIRLFGDPVLRTPAEPVTDFDRQLRNLIKDLTRTLDDAGGTGLAAPQIGVSQRVLVYDVDGFAVTWSTPAWASPMTKSRKTWKGACPSPASTSTSRGARTRWRAGSPATGTRSR